MINSIPRRSLPYFPAKIVKWIVIAFIFAQCSGCIRSRLEADLVLAGDNPVATYEYRGPRISSWNWVGFLFLESEDYGAAPEVYGNSSRLVARRFIEDIRTDGTLEHLLEFAGSLNRSNQ